MSLVRALSVTSLGRVIALATGLVVLSVSLATASSSGTPRCPTRLQAPSSSLPAAAQHLVPAGAIRVLLCRYDWRQLEGHGLITHEETLTRDFDALRPMPPGTYSCPADFGVRVDAEFFYRAGGRDTVQVDTTGCTPVSNGQLQRWAAYPPGPRLLRELLSDTGCQNERRSAGCA